MIIVLIHWRIKPDAHSEAAFFDYWTKIATIAEKTSLIGEFLSAPVSATDFPFMVDDLTVGHAEGPCRHFINVALWKDWESFQQQVGKNFDDNKPMQSFEAERRSRTILDPKQWRRGEAELTNTSTCG